MDSKLRLVLFTLFVGCGIDQSGLATDSRAGDTGIDVATDATTDGSMDSDVVPPEEECRCAEDRVSLLCDGASTDPRRVPCAGVCGEYDGKDTCLDFRPANLNQSFEEIRVEMAGAEMGGSDSRVLIDNAVYLRDSEGCVISSEMNSIRVDNEPTRELRGYLRSTMGDDVCVFAFNNIEVVRLTAAEDPQSTAPPLVLVAFENLVVRLIDFRGGWAENQRFAGPGGDLVPAPPSAGGNGTTSNRDRDGGGGGGGFATAGQNGGGGLRNGRIVAQGGSGGGTFPEQGALRPLRGGFAGGSGIRNGTPGPVGGAGGGAVQLTARRRLTIDTVLVSGAPGRRGARRGSGSGGGSGGGILLEAPSIVQDGRGYLGAAGGGGGGGRCNNNNSNDGQREEPADAAAPAGGATGRCQYQIGRGGDGYAFGYEARPAGDGLNAGGGGGGAGFVVMRSQNEPTSMTITGLHLVETPLLVPSAP